MIFNERLDTRGMERERERGMERERERGMERERERSCTRWVAAIEAPSLHSPLLGCSC